MQDTIGQIMRKQCKIRGQGWSSETTLKTGQDLRSQLE
jgi:hypothetical protein